MPRAGWWKTTLVIVAAGAAAMPGCGSKNSGTSGGQLAAGVLAQVNDARLSESDLRRLIPPELRESITGPEIRDILDRWTRTELLYQRAVKNGLEGDRQVAGRLQDLKRELLADELLQRELANRVSVTNEELQEYYQAHQNEYTQEVQIKHILVNTREEAEEIAAMVRSGAGFEETARSRSRDVSAARGGDLGYLGKGAMYPAFEAHVFGVAPGTIVGPIATPFGFHVVKVASRRAAAEPLSFDAVRDEIMHTLLLAKQQKAQAELLAELRRDASVEMAGSFAGMPLEVRAESVEDATGMPSAGSSFGGGPDEEDAADAQTAGESGGEDAAPAPPPRKAAPAKVPVTKPKAAESKPAASKAAESKPAEAKAAETKPAAPPAQPAAEPAPAPAAPDSGGTQQESN